MQNDDRTTRPDPLEHQLRAGAPLKPTAAELDVARERVAASAPSPRRSRLALRIATVLALAAIVGTGALIATSESSAPAFAYDEAADVLLPEDAVLKVELETIETSMDPDSFASLDGDQARTTTYWIDAAGDRSRTEQGESSFTIQADGRTRSLVRASDQSASLVVIVEDPTETALMANDQMTSLLPWIDDFSRGIREGDCELTEELTDDGEEVWHVVREEDLHDNRHPGVLRIDIMMRKSDYRPLTIKFAALDLEGNEVVHWVMGITEWEQHSQSDIPEGFFDPDSLDDPTAVQRIGYVAEDPRIESFTEFDAWYLGRDSAVGPLVGARYQTPYGDEPAIWDQNVITYTYGDGANVHGAPVFMRLGVTSVTVTTFGTREQDAIEAWWHWDSSMTGPERTGTVGALHYRMYVTEWWSMALTIIDGQPIVIQAPDEATVLEALAELEPL